MWSSGLDTLIINSASAMLTSQTVHAPEFAAGEWINSPPLTLTGLRGRVVLVVIWDFT